jgi:hypothetical protein
MRGPALWLAFDDDGDGTGQLLATVSYAGFSGRGGAYVSISGIHEFADAISRYPLVVGERPTISGGFWKKDLSRDLEEEHLGISVYPVGPRGLVGVQVRLATEVWEHDRRDAQKCVRLEIPTTYEALRRFAQGLVALVSGRDTEALLEAETI